MQIARSLSVEQTPWSLRLKPISPDSWSMYTRCKHNEAREVNKKAHMQPCTHHFKYPHTLGQVLVARTWAINRPHGDRQSCSETQKKTKKEKKRKTNRISIALCPWIYFFWLSWAIATDLLFSLWFIYIWFTSMDSVTLQKKKKEEEKRGVWQEYLNISVSFFSPNLLPNHIIHTVLKKFPNTEHLPKKMRNANDAGKLRHTHRVWIRRATANWC